MISDNYSDKKILLPTPLNEFCEALRDEITAAKRNESSSAVPLVNGRRIAQLGKSYQYVFDIENILNMPSDSPGDLYVEGGKAIDAVVVSVNGLSITLSIPENLGQFVPNASLRSNLTMLMKKLVERIEGFGSKSNVVGDRILGTSDVSGDPDFNNISSDLNPEQKEAVAASIGRDLTFIFGPPGTGKTQTIGEIGKKLYKSNRPVLLVSHTNSAVDLAILRIAEGATSEELKNGSILRIGEPKDERLKKEKHPLLLSTHIDGRAEELSQRRDTCKYELNALTEKTIELTQRIEICEWLDEARDDIEKMTTRLNSIISEEKKLSSLLAKQSELASSFSEIEKAADAANEIKEVMQTKTTLESDIIALSNDIDERNRTNDKLIGKLNEASNLLSELKSSSWIKRKWKGLPEIEDQENLVNQLREKTSVAEDKINSLQQNLKNSKNQRSGLSARIDSFKAKYSAMPNELIKKRESLFKEMKGLKTDIEELRTETSMARLDIEDVLKSRLSVLEQLRLSNRSRGSAEEMLKAIKMAYSAAVSKYSGKSLSVMRQELEKMNARITKLQNEIIQIEEMLEKLEETVIKEATVIATTLTRAYLRDAIQSRRFDTVILDEASMAPIPALWIAAGLADNNAVVVGDPQQLPPIVVSERAAPKKWLGKDIFDVAGVTNDSLHCVHLKNQYRMHPNISRIVNRLIYGNILRDDPSVSNEESELHMKDWYRFDWPYDNSVLLVDTGSLDAWVTSVNQGRNPSRLNFLSATTCLDIATKLLKDDRVQPGQDKPPRIIIACPYRPHAKLLKLLIRQQNLEDEVQAGTAHSFQGAEADVVILDMVNDEPHWRVGMFMHNLDPTTKRLLNVSITRAKRRLIVVGDFTYIQKGARKAFIGRDLVPLLINSYPKVDAVDIVPSGLSARVAKAQQSIISGELSPECKRFVVTQDKFFPLLVKDIDGAQNTVIIYSAFLTADRIGQLHPTLKAAIERNINVYLVTKPLSDRGKKERQHYRRIETTLANWGIIVIHKQRMHEKIVIIDDSILWMGSLNPLSFRNTQEIMERRHSKEVVNNYVNTLKITDLISEYSDGTPTCPICGSEMMASEGADDPFYWKCTEPDCYSRSIDSPKIENGEIRCYNCNGRVEYGEWGGKPHWRCVENKRHRQKIARSHVKLPKMRKLIPKRELAKLENIFNLKHKEPETAKKGNSGTATSRYIQGDLFDISKPKETRKQDPGNITKDEKASPKSGPNSAENRINDLLMNDN